MMMTFVVTEKGGKAMSKGEKSIITWQYCKNPNKINAAILTHDPNWEGLESAEQIISITYVPDQRCYVVFWRLTIGERKAEND